MGIQERLGGSGRAIALVMEQGIPLIAATVAPLDLLAAPLP
jgi:hypothetical protein